VGVAASVCLGCPLRCCEHLSGWKALHPGVEAWSHGELWMLGKRPWPWRCGTPSLLFFFFIFFFCRFAWPHSDSWWRSPAGTSLIGSFPLLERLRDGHRLSIRRRAVTGGWSRIDWALMVEPTPACGQRPGLMAFTGCPQGSPPASPLPHLSGPPCLPLLSGCCCWDERCFPCMAGWPAGPGGGGLDSTKRQTAWKGPSAEASP